MLFEGRNEIKYSYGEYGYTRGGGTIFHAGIDVNGLDSDIILMPSFEGKSISGTVVSSRIVGQNTGDLTWEWGYYVCVKLHENQTPDVVNYLYFCHNEKNLVNVGQTVKTGDAIAIMGNTGNAQFASPPLKHAHFEVRQYTWSGGLNPTSYTQTQNKTGIYGQEPITQTNEEQTEQSGILLSETKAPLGKLKALYNINIRSAPSTNCDVLGLLTAGATTDFYERQSTWARIDTGKGYAWIMAEPYTEGYNA